MEKVDELESKIQQLIQYLNVKITLRDWHAVADAAMDIRELEAKIQVYRGIEVTWYYIDEEYDFNQCVYWNEFQGSWINLEDLTGNNSNSITILHVDLRHILLF